MKKNLALEGLRGFAALIVVFCHLKNTFFINYQNFIHTYLSAYISKFWVNSIEYLISFFFDGTLAVNIFWLMSAYVISIKLFNSSYEESKDYLILSFLKRYLDFLYRSRFQ